MGDLLWIVILCMLILSAFFSGMEIAFVSANKLKIELDGKQGNILAKIISNFLKKPSRFIGAMLIGNNIALVIYGIYMEDLLEPKFSPYINNQSLILLVQTLISTIIILITAEFLPKTLFRINPNSMLRFFSLPLLMVYWILFIPVIIIIWMSELLIQWVSPEHETQEDLSFGRVDLEHYIRESTENNQSEEEIEHEIQIFQNALDFSKVKARECMVPRTEVVAMEVEEDINKLTETFIETGLSKILIYRDTIDNIIGYTHSFELFKKPESIKSILLPLPIIPISMAANEILEIFIEQRKSIAVVVDEFGGTSGILTIEDIIEEIFGEIEDEHDKEELIERKIADNEYLFSARLEVDYLNEEYNLNLPESDNYETLAGLIIDAYESIPKLNDQINSNQFTFTVRKVFENRIDLVQLKVSEEDS